MSSLFIASLVLLVLAAIALPFVIKTWKQSRREEDWEPNSLGHLVAIIVALVLGIGGGAAGVITHGLSYFIYVPVNTLAVIIDTGKPVDVVGNGVHPVKPWQTSVQFDASRQFLYFLPEGEWGKADESPDDEYFRCPMVRLASVSALDEGEVTSGAGGATACIVGTIEWQMKTDTEQARQLAVQLYKDYKSFTRMRNFFLVGTVRTVFGDTFTMHNPLTADTNQSTSELNQINLTELRLVVADRLTIHTVNLGIPDYDANTDHAIARLQEEKANTATALQAELTAAALARAAAALADAPLSYVQLKCIEAALDAIGRGQSAEPGLCMMSSDNSPIVNAG